MKTSKWYFKEGYQYFIVETKSKTQVFFGRNLDVINLWVHQIAQARRFYAWLQELVQLRYHDIDHKGSVLSTLSQVSKVNSDNVAAADQLLTQIISLAVPEVDLD